MPLTVSVFPLEIFDSIIDFLAAEDDQLFTSVKASSLVSRSFLPRARTHIFGSIIIDGQPSCILGFTRLVSETPVISHYVESLHYVVEDSGLITDGFPTALSTLTKLKSFTIEAFRVNWSDIPFESKEAIWTLMHLPGLRHLHLDKPGLFPISDLALCVGLKSLEIDFATFTALNSKDIELYRGDPPRLETFMGRNNNEDLLLQFCTARRTDGKLIVDISGLKKVTLNVEYNKSKAFFEHCTQLTDVHLQYGGGTLTFIAELLVPSLQTLAFLHLDFQLHIFSEQLFVLVHDLRWIASKNSIEKIKITIHAFPCSTLIEGYDWGALDKVFTLPDSGWEKLSALSLTFQIQCCDGDADEPAQGLQELPRTQLRDLTNSKDIQFNFDITYL